MVRLILFLCVPITGSNIWLTNAAEVAIVADLVKVLNGGPNIPLQN